MCPPTEPLSIEHCYWHPHIETGLSCSHCQKSICPDCMVQAHVGIRCKECGKPIPMPTFEVKPSHYIKSITTAIGLIILGSISWFALSQLIYLVIPGAVSFLLISLFMVPFGFVSGDLISRSVNRKRGTALAAIGGSTVAATFILGLQIPGIFLIPFYGIIATIAGTFLAIQPLRK